MPLTDFGSAAHPLRPSQLSRLVHCPVQSVMMIGEPEDGGGPAAQTGSAVHAAVAAFHLEPLDFRKVQAGADALRRSLDIFPLADLDDALRHYTLYAADPRNLSADVIAVERGVELVLPAHPTDPTREPIVVRGTLDQVRRHGGRVVVCDVKTGSPSGWAMVADHALQQSAYALAARASGVPEAEPGAIIRTQGYRARGAALPSPDGVFYWMGWDVGACELLLDRVRLEVARVRAGEVNFGPGQHCTFCPFGGVANCVPRAREKFGF